MTTIVGIRTNSGLEGVVIGADTQQSQFSSDGKPDKKKVPFFKTASGKNWVIGSAGMFEDELQKFYGLLKGQKKYGSSEEKATETIYKAIENYYLWFKKESDSGVIHFPEVNQLNAVMARRGVSLDDLNQFIFGINVPERGVKLFKIDEFGSLEESKYNGVEIVTIGSGPTKIREYIEEILESDQSPVQVDIPKAIDLVCSIIYRAEVDMYSSGPIDLHVLTSNGVDSYSKKIIEELKETEKRILEEIKGRYSPEKKDG